MTPPHDEATVRLGEPPSRSEPTAEPPTEPTTEPTTEPMSLDEVDDPRGEDGLEEGLALANLKRALFPDAPKHCIGRYEVRSVLGRGGMGVVYRAHDPQLSRDVAVKVLSKTRPESASPARLLREARALASLAHENLLPIYDVGVDVDDSGVDFGDDAEALYIVTELVEGQTLSAWLARPGRTTAEILRAFAAAGRGLMAAHAAGFVHRDFKPSNVLVGDDGRIRVGDFGLVATSSSRDDIVTKSPSSSRVDLGESLSTASDMAAELAMVQAADRERPESERLSMTNVVLGTPGFIAPEHLQGHPVDDRADQYAFCVSLYLALVRHHPYFDDDESPLDPHGRAYRPPPSSCDAPGRVRRILARGLSHDPRRRWRSMAPIVEALDASAGGRPRRRTAPVVLGVAGLSVLGLVGLVPPADPPCAAASTLAGVWGDDARQHVQLAIAGIEVDYARDAADRVIARLDTYADDWAEGYDAACRQARQATTPAAAARLSCYHERLDALAAMTAALTGPTGADAESLAGAESAVQTLPPLVACETAAAGDEDETDRAPDPVDAAPLRALHAETEVLLSARRHADATGRATEARARATALGWRWGRLEAHRHLARAHRLAGRFEEAAEAYEAVYFEATQAGEHRLALRSALGRFNVATGRAEPETGRRWAEHARALLAAHAIADAMTYALEVERNAAMIELSNGQIPLALSMFEGTLSQAEAHFGPEHPETTEARSDLALALRMAGRLDDALPLARRVVQQRVTRSGARHPTVALARATLAHVLLASDEPEPAERELREALAILEGAGLSESLGRAQTLMTLGTLLHSDGRHAAGLEAHERALAIRLAALGPDHAKVASAQTSVGMGAVRTGDRARGLELLAASLATTEASVGPETFQAGHTHYQIALVEEQVGRRDAAIEHMRAAAHGMAAELGPHHVHLAWPLSQLSRWSDDPKQRLDLAQRANAIAEAGQPGAELRANCSLALAGARIAMGGFERDGTRAVLEDAAADCADPVCRDDVARLRDQLAAR